MDEDPEQWEVLSEMIIAEDDDTGDLVFLCYDCNCGSTEGLEVTEEDCEKDEPTGEFLDELCDCTQPPG